MVVILVCKRSSSDLVRNETNSIEMRCDSAWMWYSSRYIPPAAEHSMSLQLFFNCGCSGLQRVVVILICKRSSSDLVRHETNSIEMRCDKTQNILAVRDAL